MLEIDHWGTLGGPVGVAPSTAATEPPARGEQTAENMRFGEAIGGYGFGGKTVGNGGGVGVGGGSGSEEKENTEDARRVMGYGGGSGIGG
ncbi:hypothetical protein NHQ30_011481 [Ciborinia camelliae]|nr:hypothetical protein NHQ30_011481 [Ciborinia camelliae]